MYLKEAFTLRMFITTCTQSTLTMTMHTLKEVNNIGTILESIVSWIRHDFYRSSDHGGVPSIGLLHSCDFT